MKRLKQAARRTLLCCLSLVITGAVAQQVVQRGALGRPALVLDETDQWTTPLIVSPGKDAEIYIPDVTSPAWLERNYTTFHDRGSYTLSMFTFYRTPAACRTSQINWGLGDAAHLNACIGIGYRVRQAVIDPNQKTVTLITATMVDQDGFLDTSSTQDKGGFRTWDQLDSSTLSAVQKSSALVADQMRIYEKKLESVR